MHRTRGISADTALRLGRHFGTSERFWLNLQAQYDLDVERDRLGDRLDREVTPRASSEPRSRAVAERDEEYRARRPRA